MSAKLPLADFGGEANMGEYLAKVMSDHERWSIQDGRITHDTGLWIIYHKPVGRWGSPKMELCLEGMVPFKIGMAEESMHPYYDLLDALSCAEAQETFDKVSVLLKLAAE